MANFSSLIAEIQQYIKSNLAQAITGPVLQQVLLDMVGAINQLKQDTLEGYSFYGQPLAPGGSVSVTQNTFFLVGPGTYTINGTAYVVSGAGVSVLVYDCVEDEVSTAALFPYDAAPTEGSANGVTSGGVKTALDGVAAEAAAAIEHAKGAAGLAEALLDTDSEGTEQEFSLRKSGGDGGAYFRRLLGNTKAFNQLVENGDFSNGTTGWGGITSLVDGVATVVKTATGTATTANISQSNKPYINGHTYLFVALAKSNNATTFFNIVPTGTASDGGATRAVYPNWTLVACVWTRTGTGTTLVLRGDNTGYPNDDIDFSVKYCMCIDLTAMQDNSATPEEFREKYPLLYYAYGRKLIHCKVAKVITKGANQWDEEFTRGSRDGGTGAIDTSYAGVWITNTNLIKVLPSTNYYIGNSIDGRNVYVFYFDINGNYISRNLSLYNTYKGIFTTPADCYYIGFSYRQATLDSNICINLSDAEINGQYFPYWERELALDITNQEDTDGNKPFAEGVKSCPVASDEFNEVGGIVRVGVRPYQASDDTDASVITDGVDTAYALTTPVPFTWKEPLNTGIKVSKYGTEEITPAQTENIDPAPFRAVTTYSISVANLIATLSALGAALSALGNRGGAKGLLGSGNQGENPENEELTPEEESPKEEQPKEEETPVVESIVENKR